MVSVNNAQVLDEMVPGNIQCSSPGYVYSPMQATKVLGVCIAPGDDDVCAWMCAKPQVMMMNNAGCVVKPDRWQMMITYACVHFTA